ncbi:MAG: glycosyltransferase family 4 protein [bacterium]|nr:glycosyltransferase family 4 protein [bacterium]
MKICFIGDPSSIHLTRWMNFFSISGHKVSLICFNNTIVKEINGVQIYKIRLCDFRFLPITVQTVLNMIIIPLTIRIICKKIKPDILHAHYVLDYGFYAACAWFHPLVITAWGDDVLVYPKTSQFSKWKLCFAVKQSQLVTIDSAYIKEEILRLYFSMYKTYLIHKIYNIQWGVDFESLRIGQIITPDPQLTIICPRGFQKIYNTDIIIKAMPKVISLFPNVKFVFLGAGDKTNFETLAKKLNIYKYTDFQGWIEHDKLWNIYQKAKIMISIPSSDGTSVALLEAMICGCIPVVSNLPANREWIKDGLNGVIVDIKNIERLSLGIVKALNMTETQVKEIKKHNYQFIKEKGDYRQNMLNMEKLYFRLINKR